MTKRIVERSLTPNAFVEQIPAPTGQEIDRIAILIPGIRTNAEWITNASRHFETFSVPVQGFRSFGGRISSLNLITRLGLRSIRADIKAQIIKIKIDNPFAEISLICHSMGTDMIFDILEEIEFNFDKIFFIGAICKASRANKIRRRCDTFINHVGVKDPWPILAALVRPDRYSSVGTFGFGRAAYVNDLFFDNDHESCTGLDHVSNFILPVVAGIKPLYPNETPTGFRYNTAYYTRIIVYATILISLTGAYFLSKLLLIAPAVLIALVVLCYMKKTRF